MIGYYICLIIRYAILAVYVGSIGYLAFFLIVVIIDLIFGQRDKEE